MNRCDLLRIKRMASRTEVTASELQGNRTKRVPLSPAAVIFGIKVKINRCGCGVASMHRNLIWPRVSQSTTVCLARGSPGQLDISILSVEACFLSRSNNATRSLANKHRFFLRLAGFHMLLSRFCTLIYIVEVWGAASPSLLSTFVSLRALGGLSPQALPAFLGGGPMMICFRSRNNELLAHTLPLP
jgi:hypothetical protein